MQHSPIPATALRGGIRRKEGWRGRKGPSMNSKVLLPGKLSNGEAQLAWPGFKLETRSTGWECESVPGLWGVQAWQNCPVQNSFVPGAIVASINTLGMC